MLGSTKWVGGPTINWNWDWELNIIMYVYMCALPSCDLMFADIHLQLWFCCLFAVCSVVLNLSGVGRFLGKLSKREMSDKENNAKEQEELCEKCIQSTSCNQRHVAMVIYDDSNNQVGSRVSSSAEKRQKFLEVLQSRKGEKKEIKRNPKQSPHTTKRSFWSLLSWSDWEIQTIAGSPSQTCPSIQSLQTRSRIIPREPYVLCCASIKFLLFLLYWANARMNWFLLISWLIDTTTTYLFSKSRRL